MYALRALSLCPPFRLSSASAFILSAVLVHASYQLSRSPSLMRPAVSKHSPMSAPP